VSEMVSAGQYLMDTAAAPQTEIRASTTSRIKRHRFSVDPPYLSVRWFERLGVCLLVRGQVWSKYGGRT
jgi:hypothetical protein